MVLAGVSLDNTLVLELAITLRRGSFARTADLIEGCVAAGLPEAALTDADREAILSVLVDQSAAYDGLRTALARERRPHRAPST